MGEACILGQVGHHQRLSAGAADGVAAEGPFAIGPVILDTAPTLYINMNSAQKLGVQVQSFLAGLDLG